jgi:hypothetical protein
MDEIEVFGQGIAEHCYRPGCDQWVTGASDYCSWECEAIARHDVTTIARFGEYAKVAADAMDRLRQEAEAAVEAYERYLAKLRDSA